MRALHLFFRLHRPYEIKTPENFDQGYFGGEAEFRELERTEYQPFFALIERNMQRQANLKISLAVSGPWLEQAEKWSPELVRRLRKLVEGGRVEILAQPYYHSLAAFYDKEEFAAQVGLFRQRASMKLGAECTSLALPELIYHDKIAKWADEQEFQAVLAGDADRILNWRSANYIYEAPGCEKTRVLFQNSELSRAVRLGWHEVMTEGIRKKTEVKMPEVAIGDAPVAKTKITAAEFVRGMSGASKVKASKFTVGQHNEIVETDGVWAFSAKRLQKQLEIACLRGNLINLCLDTGIFRIYREQGVVAMFDELFTSWLKVPGNRFVTASEAATLQAPRAVMSVKTTVNWRGETEVRNEAGIVSAKEVRYCPPNWLRGAEQVKMQRELYGLRASVLSSNDEDLKTDFGRLTALDYLLLYDATGVKVPAVVGEQASALEVTTLDNLKAALADFRERVPILKLPEKTEDGIGGTGSGLAQDDLAAKLTAQRLGKKAAMPGSEPEAEEDDDHSVVVHRVKKAEPRPSEPEMEETAEIGSGAENAVDGSGAEDSGTGDSCADEMVDYDDLEMDEWQEAVSDAADDAEAELQIMMQRMSRAKEKDTGIELEELVEAEVVTPEETSEKEHGKRRRKKRIVLE